MASKRRIRRRQCERKVRYASETEALKAARLARRITGEFIHAYRCGFCGGFHMGHWKRGAWRV